ncbi:uncharacterized protein LOC131939396 [Physella acuta]|uniref:uncharacterized protein LOC131939396 n=1 Tax=Physella acuta TaxID=109671 RepID=UPI0027DDD6CC|nr:uncharacterized protein LOC131939396 [Physella acuta]
MVLVQLLLTFYMTLLCNERNEKHTVRTFSKMFGLGFILLFLSLNADVECLFQWTGSDFHTSCSKGLITGLDFAIIKAQVIGSSLPQSSKTFRIETTTDGGTNFTHLCLVDLNKQCIGQVKGFFCYCNYTDNNMISHIVINIPVSSRYSESSMRGCLSIDKKKLHCKDQRLPTMSNLTYSFNNKSLPMISDSYKETVNGDTVKICCPDSPSPCAVSIPQENKNTTAERCINHVIKPNSNKEVINLTITFVICDERKSINVSFEVNLEDTGGNYWIFVIISAVIFCIMIIAVIVAIAQRKHLNKPEKRQRDFKCYFSDYITPAYDLESC